MWYEGWEMKPYLKSDQLPKINKEKKVPFGMRKNKGNFDKKPSKPLKQTRLEKKAQKIEKGDREYLDWVHTTSYPCFVCSTYQDIEWHHTKENSHSKKNHKELLPLCAKHHRLDANLSAHGNAKAFRLAYPIEVQREFAKKVYLEFLKEII